jgi:hypothetical protein
MAERGRQPGFRMSDEHRVKIQNSNILNALIEHVVGEREMSATQVSAGLGLLRKIMPDLAASTITADVTHEVGASVTDLMKAIDGRTRSK